MGPLATKHGFRTVSRVIMPPPGPTQGPNTTLSPTPVVDEERLALLAAAERERVLKHNSYRPGRRTTLMVMLVVFVAFFGVAYFTAPEPPTTESKSGDARAVALALASSVDAAAAPTGLSSAAWVKNVFPTGVISALTASGPLGLSAADVVVEGPVVHLRAASWQADLTYMNDRASLVSPDGSKFCVAFATLPKAPSEVTEKGC